MKNLLILGLCFCLAACAHVQPQVRPLVEPQFGMTKFQMLDLMGRPDSIEIYQRSDQTRIEFYIYVRQYQSKYRLPICLINDKVVGWGKTYYEDHVNQDDMTRIK